MDAWSASSGDEDVDDNEYNTNLNSSTTSAASSEFLMLS
jgi:hypothetical protein